MKLFINARFLTQAISGVQRYAIECSRQIKKLHTDVTFVAPRHIVHEDIAKELNVKLIGKNKGHLWEQWDLPRYLAREKYPPLLSLANTAPLYYPCNFVTIHDLAFHHNPQWNSRAFSLWYNFLIPRLVRNSRHIFTVSSTIREEIISSYKVAGEKVSVTYNGVSQNMLAAGGSKPVKEKLILSVGTFNIRKNHPNLVSGYLGSGLHNEYSLVLVGDKNRVFREGGIDEGTLADTKIKIYPTLSEHDLISLYQKAEIVISLSLYEGFGIPVLEGLYNGCKVICSDIPVYRELYSRYVHFCNPLDINSIAAAIKEVAGAHAAPIDLRPLSEHFSYSKSAEKIIDEILSGAK